MPYIPLDSEWKKHLDKVDEWREKTKKQLRKLRDKWKHDSVVLNTHQGRSCAELIVQEYEELLEALG